jgi:hypothetical protein
VLQPQTLDNPGLQRPPIHFGLVPSRSDTAFDSGAKNMDLAVDARGRVYVADTARLEVLVFEPAREEAP